MATEVVQRGIVARALSALGVMPDGAQNQPAGARFGRYGEQYVNSPVSTKHLLADEGSYFIATNPTPGTGLAGAISTGFVDTVAFLAIQNKAAPGGKRIYLDYLKLLMSGTAPTATTVMHFAAKLDGKDRTPTAGSPATLVPVNVNGDDGTQSVANVLAVTGSANMTVPAAGSSARIVTRASIATGLGITGDEYELRFGAADAAPARPPLTAVRATDCGRLVSGCPPVIIAPGQWFILHRWWLTEATNAPTFETELAWWER